MPMFKTTQNLLKNTGEYFEPAWMESNKLILPPGGPDDIKNHWDYNQELHIDKVDLWEVISEGWSKCGVYASWLPYADFFVIVNYNNMYPLNKYGYWDGKIKYDPTYEEFYGYNAEKRLISRMKELKIPIHLHQHWVDGEQLLIKLS